MGTVVTFDLYPGTGALRDPYLHIARARAALQRADAVFSTWRDSSAISMLRRGEIDCEAAPPEVAEVLAACARAREVTHGWFDPWAMPGGVDPTGYVKGWAADRALQALLETGAAGVIVNAAGDVATRGRPMLGSKFRIGIADPRSPQRLTCVVEIDGAIATSGSYERGDHLIDPFTGSSRACAASASVTGPDLGLADALATALAVVGSEGLEFVESFTGYEGLVIEFNGEARATSRFPFARDVPLAMERSADLATTRHKASALTNGSR